MNGADVHSEPEAVPQAINQSLAVPKGMTPHGPAALPSTPLLLRGAPV